MLPFLDVPRPRFNPARLPGLAAWYDAADSSTVLTSIEPNVSATDGQTVRRWLDKSGNGRHLDQADLALQPAFELSGLNSRPSIKPDGVNDFMLSGVYSIPTTATVVAVCQDATPSGSFKVLIGGNIAVLPGMDFGKDSAQNFYFATTAAYSAGVMPTAPFVATAVVGGGTGQIWRNKTSAFSGSSGNPFSNNIRVFSNGAAALLWSGRASEFLVYESKLTPEQAARVQDYLIRKWGITL